MRLVLTLLIALFATSPAVAQMSSKEKLRKIDHEIDWYEGRKKTGMIMTGIGVALAGLSFTAYPTTDCDGSFNCEEKGSIGSFVAMSLGGIVLASWGGYRWSDASYNIRQLELKKYDISWHPLYMPKQGNALGLAMTAGF